ncbi:extensin family protein [Tateyamaria omphalii]|uniref:extensin-like domain-containing protein n=1 Tax=Tateyamaria omphalii TaxID=299262 RepID=UPI001C991A54|nr:extensin family protein [Tateyamaria omphalii]MBY5931636.1 extensin family protein [Tateyamaria omphalii]
MRALALGLMLVAGVASAAPETSKRPVARAGTDVQSVEVPPVIPAAPSMAFVATLPEPGLSLRPFLRPKAVIERAMARRAERRRGQVCGDPDLQGDEVGYVPGRISGCGIQEAVRLRSVSGVTLSQSALMDCTTAKALKRWTEKGAKPALRGTGGGLAGYRVAAHYACRTRNNQPGARISEHGKGRAIDISGFQLKDGTSLTVLNDWNSRHRRALRQMHKAACGPFGTVLGPNSDRFHRDHFHFDTARYRGGTYCR